MKRIIYSTVISIFIFFAYSLGNAQNIEGNAKFEDEGITTETHRKNVGKIVWSEEMIPKVAPDENKFKSNLSSPEKSWETLLHWFKEDNVDSIKTAVTNNGFNDLIMSISPYSESNPFGSILQCRGNQWSQWDLKWEQINKNKVRLVTGTEELNFYFIFIKIDEKWKMDTFQN